MGAKEYVDWFHKVFPTTYGTQWTGIKSDHYALIEIVEYFDVKTVLEIGMWEGYTTLLFRLHPLIEKVKTIDPKIGYGHGYHYPRGTYGKFIENTDVIQQEVSSKAYVPEAGEQWDMVFVDGNHDYDFVLNDFHLALKLNPKVISFHDYYNGNTGVDKCLDELISQGVPVRRWQNNEANVVAYIVPSEMDKADPGP